MEFLLVKQSQRFEKFDSFILIAELLVHQEIVSFFKMNITREQAICMYFSEESVARLSKKSGDFSSLWRLLWGIAVIIL